MTAQVLVAYASKKGSTAGIAEAVAKELRSAGHTADVAEMGTVSSLEGYDAVVIGAPVYAGKVMGEVASFAKHHRDGLARLPLAGFVTGIAPVFPKTGDVKDFTDQLVAALQPATPVTVTMFAGTLDPAKLSLVERGLTSILKVPTGDFRDWNSIAEWAKGLPGILKI
jgi:menaquinone-dependent protoporphyrinogen oxidase